MKNFEDLKRKYFYKLVEDGDEIDEIFNFPEVSIEKLKEFDGQEIYIVIDKNDPQNFFIFHTTLTEITDDNLFDFDDEVEERPLFYTASISTASNFKNNKEIKR